MITATLLKQMLREIFMLRDDLMAPVTLTRVPILLPEQALDLRMVTLQNIVP